MDRELLQIVQEAFEDNFGAMSQDEHLAHFNNMSQYEFYELVKDELLDLHGGVLAYLYDIVVGGSFPYAMVGIGDNIHPVDDVETAIEELMLAVGRDKWTEFLMTNNINMFYG